MAHWIDFLNPTAPDGCYLRWREVEARVGISRTTAWRLQKAGEFPAPYVMSTGRVGYRESEIEAWIASRAHRTEPPARRPGAGARPMTATRTETTGDAVAQHTPSEPTPPPRERAPSRDARHARPPRPRHAPGDQATFDF